MNLKSIFLALLLIGVAYSIAPVTDLGTNSTIVIPNENILFDGSNSYDPEGIIVAYDWDFNNDGTIDQTTFPPVATTTHAYAIAGTYTAKLIMTDGEGLFTDDTATITVHNPPNAVIQNLPAVVKLGAIVTFDGSASTDDGSIIKYEWNFGDGITGTGSIVTHTYGTLGNKVVKLTVTDNYGVKNTATFNLRVNQAPVAAATANPTLANAGNAINFDSSGSTDDVAIASYSWDFKDGTPLSFLQNPAHQFAVAGAYEVTLTVTDGDGETNSTKVRVVINGPPTADAGADKNVNVLDVVQFSSAACNDDIGIVEYTWDFGDGTAQSKLANPTHVFKDARVPPYIVTLSVKDRLGLPASDTMQVFVNAYPTVDAGVDQWVNEEEVVTLTADASDLENGAITYLWNFGDGSKTAAGNPVLHTYAAHGTYTASVTVKDNKQASATDTLKVYVNALPVANAGADQITIAGEQITLDGSQSTDDGTIVKYEWDFDGNGVFDQTSTNPIITHAYTIAGTYNTVLKVTDNNATTAQDLVVIKVLGADKQRPTAVAGGDRTIPVNQELYFQATGTDADGTIASYTWNFGDGTTSNQQNIAHKFRSTGVYTVTLTATDNDGLTGKDIIHVTVKTTSNILIKSTALANSTGFGGEEVAITVDAPNADEISATLDDETEILKDTAGNGKFTGTVKFPGTTGTYILTIKVVKGTLQETETKEIKVDNTAPVITEFGPKGNVTEYVQTVFVKTDESAVCRFSETAGTAFENMKPFTHTGSTYSYMDATIGEGTVKTYYVMCKDSMGNTMTRAQTIAFSRAAEGASAPQDTEADEEEESTTSTTGFFGMNMTSFQMAMIFILVVLTILSFGVFVKKKLM